LVADCSALFGNISGQARRAGERQFQYDFKLAVFPLTDDRKFLKETFDMCWRSRRENGYFNGAILFTSA